MKRAALPIALLLSMAGHAQPASSPWQQEVQQKMEAFRVCETSLQVDCYKFIGQTLQTIYRVNDFYTPSTQRYMPASEIVDLLKDHPRWVFLGYGYQQEALQQAQEYANQGRAAVAVYLNAERVGHVAFILPGELQPSGSWKFDVPNSMAYFTGEPGKSYVNKALSYSFPRSLLKEVLLYGRKK